VLDLLTGQWDLFIVPGQTAPVKRRRHNSCFIGASLIIFGGYNGEFLKDFY